MKTCENCMHKSVCILYHGHGQIQLRFGNTYSKDPDAFVDRLDQQLAYKCMYYLEKPAVGIVESEEPPAETPDRGGRAVRRAKQKAPTSSTPR